MKTNNDFKNSIITTLIILFIILGFSVIETLDNDARITQMEDRFIERSEVEKLDTKVDEWIDRVRKVEEEMYADDIREARSILKEVYSEANAYHYVEKLYDGKYILYDEDFYTRQYYTVDIHNRIVQLVKVSDSQN